MVDECLAWQRNWLAPPASVRVATDDYLSAEDVLGQWLEDRCIVSARLGWVSLSSLYGAWKLWCEARGQNPGTSTALSKKLDERGFQRQRTKQGAGFVGIGLAEQATCGDTGDGNDGNPVIDRSDPLHARVHAYAPYAEDRHFRHRPPGGAEPAADGWADL